MGTSSDSTRVTFQPRGQVGPKGLVVPPARGIGRHHRSLEDVEASEGGGDEQGKAAPP